MADKPRQPPQNVPDSLPKRDDGTDVMPDDVRRVDPSRRVPPDSLTDRPAQGGVEQSADGGVESHPIHDDDLEDKDPEDFEEDIARIESAGALRR